MVVCLSDVMLRRSLWASRWVAIAMLRVLIELLAAMLSTKVCPRGKNSGATSGVGMNCSKDRFILSDKGGLSPIAKLAGTSSSPDNLRRSYLMQ